ncbi:uncharacterized protein LOC141812830 isoform X2 [Curcuma longa]|uniref:uncharacterized protein LOC141812830 isoform X2 n=1 Tax=Curcuma longa TaxID=136217 RepID=UPI003D9FAC6D
MPPPSPSGLSDAFWNQITLSYFSNMWHFQPLILLLMLLLLSSSLSFLRSYWPYVTRRQSLKFLDSQNSQTMKRYVEEVRYLKIIVRPLKVIKGS